MQTETATTLVKRMVVFILYTFVLLKRANLTIVRAFLVRIVDEIKKC